MAGGYYVVKFKTRPADNELVVLDRHLLENHQPDEDALKAEKEAMKHWQQYGLPEAEIVEQDRLRREQELRDRRERVAAAWNRMSMAQQEAEKRCMKIDADAEQKGQGG